MRSKGTTQLSLIKQSIKLEIAQISPKGSHKLPSERAYCQQFNSSRVTIKDVLTGLETEGIIYREERRGWFVSPKRIEYNPLSRTHFHHMIDEQQREATTQVLAVITELADVEVASILKIEAQSKTVHRIERLRFVDNRAVLFVENCLIGELFPDILQQDLSQSLTGIFLQKYGYHTTRSHFDVIPTSASKKVAKALHLAEGQQVLKITRVNYNQQQQLMDCEFEYWRPDSVMITIDSLS